MAQLGLQRVDASLATNGLGTFELPVVEETKVGGMKSVVEEACGILQQKSAMMETLTGELETAKESLLNGEWTGQAADDFATAFPQMINAFEEIAPCIKSLATWAETTMEAYDVTDKAIALQLSEILK